MTDQKVAWRKESLLDKLRRRCLRTVSLAQLTPCLFLSPGTREALLHPELVREADENIEWNWARPKFFARSWGEELKTKRRLYAKGIVTAEDPEVIWRCRGQAVEMVIVAW